VAEHEFVGDLAVGHAPGDQDQDLEFARGQLRCGAHAASGKTQTLHLFDKPVSLSLTMSHGKVISPPTISAAATRRRARRVLVGLSRQPLHRASHWTLSKHFSCAFAQRPPTCVSNVATGSSLLVFDGNKLVGATGAYQGATGQVLSNKTIPNTNNQADIVVAIKRG
jgi:hypothetical protein